MVFPIHGLPREGQSTRQAGINYTAFGKSVPAHFERSVRFNPKQTALRCRLGEISYEELNAAANRAAHRILSTGGKPGDRVALLMPQDRRAFLAMLGGLKAKRIVLLLNSTDPPARIRQLIDDAEPSLFLTVDSHLKQAHELAGPDIGVINLDRLNPADLAENPSLEIEPDDTAFLVYTSGSTGQPKGVMQTHGHTIRDAIDVREAVGLVPQDRVLLLASLWGAQALCTSWITLLNGATLTSFPVVENGVGGLAEWLNEQRVSIFIAASSLFRHFIKAVRPAAQFSQVRLVKLSADPATREDFESVLKHFPNARFMHNIGVTELGHLAYLMLERDAIVRDGRLPIGRPFKGVDLRILDEHGRDCPVGVTGNISAGLPYLAAGYWRDPAMTAKCFLPGPNGTRIFRGGDRAFINEEGLIVHAGRRDATYKIRGQRVDIAEVERGLSCIEGIDEIAVVPCERANGELHLVVYIVPSTGFAMSSRRMRNAARALLPRHLVPSLFVVADTLPRSANGKVDRSELRRRAPPLLRDSTIEPPKTEIEALLVRIWGDALDLDSVGRLDDFFELGGDSLIATVIAAHLQNAKQVDLDFGAFVEHPVLKDLAKLVDGKRPTSTAGPLPRSERNEPAPLSYVQEYYWRRSIQAGGSNGLVLAAAGRIEGPLDVDVLRRSLGDIVARHEILRTCFRVGKQAEGAVQSIHPESEPPLPLIDLSSKANADVCLETLLNEERTRSFDLTAAPPVSFRLVKLRTDCHALLQSSHHIIADGPSWNIFLRELAHFYPARLEGKEPALAPLAVQYADYSVWEREQWRRDGEALSEAARWWKHELRNLPVPPAGGWLGGYRRQGTTDDFQPDDWSLKWGLDTATSERLDALARGLNATYFAVRLAATVPVCAMATGIDKVALSAVRTGRTRIELQPMFGPLLSYAVLALSCDWRWTFRDLIAHTRQKLLDVQKHADVPYSLLMEEFRNSGLQPPQPIMLVHRTTPTPPLSFGGLKVTWSSGNRHPMRPGIMARFDEMHERDGCLFVFDARTYSAGLLREFLDCLRDFIDSASVSPNARLGDLIELSGVGERLRHRRK